MFDAFGFSLLLLPLAVGCGWYLRSRFKPPEDAPPPKTQYLQGVQYLVNEQTDKAIDVFIKLLDVDRDTIDTHLALGSLFRRRGEVDRALRIHQNLVARPNLDNKHRNRARYELAQDYLTAGVLDRAESLYQELLEQGMFREESVAALISIYEKEREWVQAIDASRRQEGALGQTQRPRIAQYACELAEEALWEKQYKTAADWIKRALADDRDCVRASLLRGKLCEAQDDHRAAIKAYLRVADQDTHFISEIIEPLKRCFDKAGDTAGWHTAIAELATQNPTAPVHIARAEALEAERGAGTDYLADYLAEAPSWTAFLSLLELTDDEALAAADAATGGHLAAPLDSLRRALANTLASTPLYRCEHCGFSGRAMHWQCPRCRHWNSVLPVDEGALAIE